MIKSKISKNCSLISYADYGDRDGFPILVQHGLIASIKDDALFIPLIRAGARVICAARPGYGETPPFEMKNIGEWGDLIALLVAELELTRFDVLGISSGAPYSYAIGSRFPKRARNLYIFSGIPALDKETVAVCWPFEVIKDASIREMQKLAKELFFSNLSESDLHKNEIKDSMKNDCFGLGQDFRLRGMDWGFKLADLNQKVFMRHARMDPAVPYITAEITANMLTDCSLQVDETDVHFSEESLADFITSTILPRLI